MAADEISFGVNECVQKLNSSDGCRPVNMLKPSFKKVTALVHELHAKKATIHWKVE